eukprot:gb/GEZN01008977.1/.p1 GENE.gb/GEZN01008977.1/~~gb/GEZN01008977.1/.p1  ORF type:complete len:340 (-),score=42.62 gb/GEZN01008977.1/:242-1261(-)
MPRHGQNNTASPFVTNEEFKKMGYGTRKVRMSGDMLKDFDACHLCLHQAESPMACSKGHLFCKACIFECLLRQKEHQKTQTKLYEEQQLAEQAKVESLATKGKQEATERFQKLEEGILNPVHTTAGSLGGSSSSSSSSDNNKNPLSKTLIGYSEVTTNSGEQVYVIDDSLVNGVMAAKNSSKLSAEDKEIRLRVLPSFWIPTQTPDQVENKIAPPQKHTACPAGSHVLKLKGLTPVHFALVDEGDVRRKGDSTKGKYMCGGCRKTLTNSNKLFVLKKCGHIACSQCMDNLVKHDKRCVECQTKLKLPQGVVELESGGRSFAAHGAKVVSSRLTPAVGNS